MSLFHCERFLLDILNRIVDFWLSLKKGEGYRMNEYGNIGNILNRHHDLIMDMLSSKATDMAFLLEKEVKNTIYGVKKMIHS